MAWQPGVPPQCTARAGRAAGLPPPWAALALRARVRPTNRHQPTDHPTNQCTYCCVIISTCNSSPEATTSLGSSPSLHGTGRGTGAAMRPGQRVGGWGCSGALSALCGDACTSYKRSLEVTPHGCVHAGGQLVSGGGAAIGCGGARGLRVGNGLQLAARRGPTSWRAAAGDGEQGAVRVAAEERMFWGRGKCGWRGRRGGPRPQRCQPARGSPRRGRMGAGQQDQQEPA